jgi:hypothetical protein
LIASRTQKEVARAPVPYPNRFPLQPQPQPQLCKYTTNFAREQTIAEGFRMLVEWIDRAWDDLPVVINQQEPTGSLLLSRLASAERIIDHRNYLPF